MDWQQRYVEQDTPWDKGYAAPVLVDLLASHPFIFSRKRGVLVPGCGKGYDALVLAECGLEVMGVDVAEVAVSEASAKIPVDLGERLHFESEDIFALPSKYNGAFDLVWEHTCFCAIRPEQRQDYVKAMWRSLRAGGCLLGVFFVNPDMDPGEEGPPFKANRDEIRDSFGGLFSLEWECEPSSFYPEREGREWVMLFRRLEVCGGGDCC